ncbi:uncharacterized protein EI90DRAFT_3035785 [Cantharellus anzutake]|uniref:uncharacterized protein n=1 Tax=Cantharellus anzutake TaxID=1750568 RepID=UPI001906C30B|nr:uncharacterized protein EI90DRAFT_3035785 [Cantharellus anzutake]KAF8340498.1 hypothetical protein EI90DRAFT_3035785 [Cantharellus anzutake]
MDRPTNQPEGSSQRNSFTYILLITWIVFMTSGFGEDVTTRRDLEDILDRMEDRISNYSAWLNGTSSNFTLTPEPPTLTPLLNNMLPPIDIPDPRTHSYYRNITGFIEGKTKAYNLSDKHLGSSWAPFAVPFANSLNTTETQANIGLWNISEAKKLSANVREYGALTSNNIHFLRGTVDFADRDSSRIVKYELDAVHVLETGTLYGFAKKLGSRTDIRHVSALVPERYRNETAQAVLSELEQRRRRLKAFLQSGQSVDSDASPDSETKRGYCSYIFRAQLFPTPAPQNLLREFEEEIMQPTGQQTIQAEPAELDAVFVSHDCGVLVEMKKGTTLRSDTFWRKSVTYSSVAFCLYLVIAYSLANQIEWTRTPASISRVSRWPFVIQALADLYAFLLHMTIGVTSNNRASLSLIAPGFVAAVLFFVLEVRYAVLIHRIQAPEDAAAAAARPSPPPPTPAAAAATAAINRRQTAASAPQVASLPTRTPEEPARTTPRFPLLHIIVNVISEPLMAGWISMILSIIILLQLMVNPKLILGVLYAFHSFWIPQIVRNAKRGTRRALRKRYVLTTTVCRAFFPLYALACPKNVLFFDTDYRVWTPIAWMIVQVGILFGQEYLGPAFFLPVGWEPAKTYDYHAVIPLPDPETPDQAQALGDCSVCLEPIVHQPPDASRSDKEKDLGTTSLLGTSLRLYSIAPCHHMFHTACLEKWLGVKNICPVCRRHLPPL